MNGRSWILITELLSRPWESEGRSILHTRVALVGGLAYGELGQLVAGYTQV